MERRVNMKITKEVKEYAIQQFEAKVRESKIKFCAPEKELCESIELESKEVLKAINKLAVAFKSKYSDEANIKLDKTYNYNTQTYDLVFDISVKHKMVYEEPNKAKFLAELSIGESLEDLDQLLNKYFE